MPARVAAGSLLAFWRTEPLAPPGFEVDLYPTHLYLFFVNAVDRLAGGGMISLRALSIGSSLVLFLGALLLAREAAREKPGAFLAAASLLATSLWLLVPARWATDVVSTSAVLVFSAAAALAAARKNSLPLAALAGGLLGIAQYGYVASRLALLVPVVVLVFAGRRRDRLLARLVATALAASLVVALPLFLHLAAQPGRLTARVSEVAILSKPPSEALRAFGANLVDYAALFTVRGDVNRRHGDPTRPVVLPGIALLALAGAVTGIRRGGAERFLLLSSAAFIAGGLLARDAESANASRISPAAPFILVLAGLGGARLVELLPEGRRRVGWIGLGLVVALSAALDVAAFVRWTQAPENWFGFDRADRLLAETLAAETARDPAEIVIHPRACRNVNVADVLLGKPGEGGRRNVAVAALESDLPWTRVPRADVLYVTGPPEAAVAATAFGGVPIGESRTADGRVEWALFRIPRAAAREAARRAAERFVLEPAEDAGRSRRRRRASISSRRAASACVGWLSAAIGLRWPPPGHRSPCGGRTASFFRRFRDGAPRAGKGAQLIPNASKSACWKTRGASIGPSCPTPVRTRSRAPGIFAAARRASSSGKRVSFSPQMRTVPPGNSRSRPRRRSSSRSDSIVAAGVPEP